MNINIGDKRYIISDAAKLIEVESHVLRYWEEELSIEIPRNELGHRYYTDYYIELFKKIKELKDGGFQLKAIKMLLPELMEMSDEGASQGNSLGVLKDELFGKLVASGEESSGRGDMNDINRAEINQDNMNSNDIIKENNEAGDRVGNDIGKGEESGRKEDIFDEKKKSESHTPEVSEEFRSEQITELSEVEETEVATEVSDKNSKLEQFQMIITEVVSNALKENTGTLGKEVSEIVSDNVIKEMDYLMHLKEKQEEERFKKLDETIRSYQVSSREKSKVNKGIFSILKKL